MDIIGICVYFTIILAGVLLGLAAGLGILSFAYTRQENKLHIDKIDFVMGYSDDHKKNSKNGKQNYDKKHEEAIKENNAEETETNSHKPEKQDGEVQKPHKKSEGVLAKRLQDNNNVSYTNILCEESEDSEDEVVYKKLKTQDSKYKFAKRD